MKPSQNADTERVIARFLWVIDELQRTRDALEAEQQRITKVIGDMAVLGADLLPPIGSSGVAQ